jgi:hypothetical protein
LNRQVGVGSRVARLDAAASAAGQLTSRLGGPLHDGCDLLEWPVEDVVQDERHAFGRRERLEHHEQREPDAVGEQRRMLGADSINAVDDRFGDAGLAPRAARSEHVQRDPCDNGRQPRAEVVDFLRCLAES